MNASVRMSVCPSVRHTFFTMFHHRIIMKFSGIITMDISDVHAKIKGKGRRSRSQRSKPDLAIYGP